MGTSIQKFWFSDNENFVFWQEKGAFLILFFFPNPPHPSFTFLFLYFSLLFLSLLLRHKNVSNPPEMTHCSHLTLVRRAAGVFFDAFFSKF
jgi:hypothetical protein